MSSNKSKKNTMEKKTKIQDSESFALEIVSSMPDHTEYINIAWISAKICKYMQQFTTMSGKDKKMMAMHVVRRVFQLCRIPINEFEMLISDLIDCAIVIYKEREQMAAHLNQMQKCCCSCVGTSKSQNNLKESEIASQIAARDFSEKRADKDLNLNTYLNLAHLIKTIYENVASTEGLDDKEKRSQTLIYIKEALDMAHIKFSDRMVADILDMFNLIRDGWFTLENHSEELKKCISSCTYCC
jgi:hypothetical protein